MIPARNHLTPLMSCAKLMESLISCAKSLKSLMSCAKLEFAVVGGGRVHVAAVVVACFAAVVSPAGFVLTTIASE